MDKEKFCALVRENEKSMYALAMSILRNRDDAADCLQDAILKAYTKIDFLKDERKFKAWIMTIVHNCAIGTLRTRCDMVDISECEDLGLCDLDISKEIVVSEALGKMKNPYRCAVYLFYYEQMSVRQIAKVTETSEENVRARLARGRKMLAKLLDKESLIS